MILFRLATLKPTEEELRQLPETLNTETNKKRKAGTDTDTKQQQQSTKTIFREEGDADADDDNLFDDQNDDNDYLSLSTTTKFRVVHTQKDLMSKSKAGIAESVLNFKETMLYGRGSKIRREATQDVLRRKEKVKLIQNSMKKSNPVV